MQTPNKTLENKIFKNKTQLKANIQNWAKILGFDAVGFSNIDLAEHEAHLQAWLDKGFHGEMAWMQKHGTKRSRPAELEPGTLSIISVRMNYYPPDSAEPWSIIENSEKAYISRYALGRDYHKVIRKRLQKLAQKIEAEIGHFGYRAFTDSAPVLEKAIAEKAGLGWIGKHTNLLSRDAGSWFFLGEIYTDLPLVETAQDENKSAGKQSETKVEKHCGRCTACIDICPTQAIIAPQQLDARRCISYLTIELRGSIPEALRPLMGNRIYGCDDCQLVCPWNRFAQQAALDDFAVRQQLDQAGLLDLFEWTEKQFLQRLEGSAIRRIGYEAWLRNIAVALGNADYNIQIVQALKAKAKHPSILVREHVAWALQQQDIKTPKGHQ